MPYIDYQYYTEEYKGTEIDEVTFEKYATRASQVIDQLTNDVLHGQKFTQIAQYLQDKVKLATAAQVEFYVSKGGYETVETGSDDLTNVTIGSFSYQEGSNQSSSANAKRISPTVLEHLKPTGLLYRGLGVVQRAVY